MVSCCSLSSSFFIAIARVVVNLDAGGGTAPDPLVWSAGSLPKRPRITHAVRDSASLHGPVGIWDGSWVSFGVRVVSLLRMFAFGLILCLFLLRYWDFLVLCIGRLVMLSLVLEVCLLLSCSFFMSSWLVNGFFLRLLFLSLVGLDVQFQCRLFLLVQALIFGVLVGSWVLFFVLYVYCLVALVGFFLEILVLIIAVFGTLVGISAVMVFRPGLVRLLLFGFWMNFSFSLAIVLILVLTCLLGCFLLGILLLLLLVGSLLGGCLFRGVLPVFFLLVVDSGWSQCFICCFGWCLCWPG